MPAFTLIEMLTVIAIIAILMAIGADLLRGTAAYSRRTAADDLSGMIDRARASAIASRSIVVIAIAEPGALAANDSLCRIGLFNVERWPDSPNETIDGIRLGRWRTFKTGVVLLRGPVDGIDNPLDAPEITLSYGIHKQRTVKVRAIAINSRGALHYPSGSSPVVLRVAEGNYRSGEPTPFPRGDGDDISENLIRIGRVIARPYRIDG
jgi:prepilin-type N-terminal cleavage/methylation domain-containing protein